MRWSTNWRGNAVEINYECNGQIDGHRNEQTVERVGEKESNKRCKILLSLLTSTIVLLDCRTFFSAGLLCSLRWRCSVARTSSLCDDSTANDAHLSLTSACPAMMTSRAPAVNLALDVIAVYAILLFQKAFYTSILHSLQFRPILFSSYCVA